MPTRRRPRRRVLRLAGVFAAFRPPLGVAPTLLTAPTRPVVARDDALLRVAVSVAAARSS
ncbi:MAG TPA: hypothetical protein VF163_11430 [Micromonosporaceae bacterium]